MLLCLLLCPQGLVNSTPNLSDLESKCLCNEGNLSLDMFKPLKLKLKFNIGTAGVFTPPGDDQPPYWRNYDTVLYTTFIGIAGEPSEYRNIALDSKDVSTSITVKLKDLNNPIQAYFTTKK